MSGSIYPEIQTKPPLVAAGAQLNEYATILGGLAVMFAAINVVGGYLVTNRMLSMFKKKEDDQQGAKQ